MRFTLRSIMLTILMVAIILSPLGESWFLQVLMALLWMVLPAIFVTVIRSGRDVERTAACGGLATFIVIHLPASFPDRTLPVGYSNFGYNLRYIVSFIAVAISMGLSVKCHDWLTSRHTWPQSHRDSVPSESDDAN